MGIIFKKILDFFRNIIEYFKHHFNFVSEIVVFDELNNHVDNEGYVKGKVLQPLIDNRIRLEKGDKQKFYCFFNDVLILKNSNKSFTALNDERANLHFSDGFEKAVQERIQQESNCRKYFRERPMQVRIENRDDIEPAEAKVVTGPIYLGPTSTSRKIYEVAATERGGLNLLNNANRPLSFYDDQFFTIGNHEMCTIRIDNINEDIIGAFSVDEDNLESIRYEQLKYPAYPVSIDGPEGLLKVRKEIPIDGKNLYLDFTIVYVDSKKLEENRQLLFEPLGYYEWDGIYFSVNKLITERLEKGRIERSCAVEIGKVITDDNNNRYLTIRGEVTGKKEGTLYSFGNLTEQKAVRIIYKGIPLFKYYAKYFKNTNITNPARGVLINTYLDFNVTSLSDFIQMISQKSSICLLRKNRLAEVQSYSTENNDIVFVDNKIFLVLT